MTGTNYKVKCGNCQQFKNKTEVRHHLYRTTNGSKYLCINKEECEKKKTEQKRQ